MGTKLHINIRFLHPEPGTNYEQVPDNAQFKELFFF